MNKAIGSETAENEMILCENLVKIYKTGEIEVIALQGLDLTVEKGELMAFIGNSGSGKSTLMNIIGGLDRPTAGQIRVNGTDLLALTSRKLQKYVRENIGFVWQNNARNLIPYLTVKDNVMLPMQFTGKIDDAWADELIDMVDLSGKKKSRLHQLSGGEQQRVAIAIALANKPVLLLADEPTGSVDTKTTARIIKLFNEVNEKLGITVVIVTHDRQLSRMVNRVVSISDGRISSEYLRYREMDMQTVLNATEGHDSGNTHIELSVIDGRGRLQVPEHYLSALGLGKKANVEMRLENEQITIRKQTI